MIKLLKKMFGKDVSDSDVTCDYVVECLIDEIMYSGTPSETTIAILTKIKHEYKIVDEYLMWRTKKNG